LLGLLEVERLRVVINKRLYWPVQLVTLCLAFALLSLTDDSSVWDGLAYGAFLSVLLLFWQGVARLHIPSPWLRFLALASGNVVLYGLWAIVRGRDLVWVVPLGTGVAVFLITVDLSFRHLQSRPHTNSAATRGS
jgi:hypothetical protein